MVTPCPLFASGPHDPEAPNNYGKYMSTIVYFTLYERSSSMNRLSVVNSVINLGTYIRW